MVLKIEDFRRLDINYRYYYGSLAELMAKAGAAVASTVNTKFGVGNRILIVCGSGNKAGDGLVAAEKLRANNIITVIFAKGKESIRKGDAADALKKYTGEIADLADLDRELKRSDVVIDALLGTGISGKPRPPYDDIISQINSSGAKIVSVDVPSGLGTPLAVKPIVTVTFHDIKKGMTPDNSGEMEIVDIGIPKDLKKKSGPGDFIYVTEPRKDSHKGMNGVLGVIGGWTYHGSAVIASLGALGTGPDLVNIIVPPEKYNLMASFSPEIVIRPYEGLDRLSEELHRFDALVIGPGLGEEKEIRKLLLKLISTLDIPAVIDADAIKLLAGQDDHFRDKPLIFTPHSREFELLTGMKASEEALLEFCSRTGVTVVLKGETDLICDGDSVFETPGGNARLTMGGTGDLLAGIIGGFLSKGVGPVEACRLGTFIVKKAAGNLFEDKAFWYSIRDLIDEIPYTVKETWEFCRE